MTLAQRGFNYLESRVIIPLGCSGMITASVQFDETSITPAPEISVTSLQLIAIQVFRN